MGNKLVDEHLKKRLVGATVLVALAVIFIPMLLEDESSVDTGITRTNIPPRPEAPFTSRIQPVEPAAEPAKTTAAPKPVKPPAQPAPAKMAVVQPSATKASEAPAKTKVPALKPASKPIESWVIQVGSFSKQENAENLIKSLRAEKFAAFMEKVVVDKQAMYRVRVGPEVDQKKAQEMQARIESKFKLKGKLEHYP